jgi:hypothetical protein
VIVLLVLVNPVEKVNGTSFVESCDCIEDVAPFTYDNSVNEGYVQVDNEIMFLLASVAMN